MSVQTRQDEPLSLVTPLYARVGRKLVDGMQNQTVVRDDAALRDFSIRPRGVREAVATHRVLVRPVDPQLTRCPAGKQTGKQTPNHWTRGSRVGSIDRPKARFGKRRRMIARWAGGYNRRFRGAQSGFRISQERACPRLNT